mmetsp:Transcript_95924/g.271527  ORF Transcript_95924/g.271527 Transcript_95924/m.271527 type:complete len:347 (-) Transcript_95924:38-1078(-)
MVHDEAAAPGHPLGAFQPRLLRILLCLGYGLGVIVFMAIYGLLQERIITRPYGGEFFKFSLLLVFWNRVIAVACSAVMMAVHRDRILWTPPLWKYVAISASNVVATSCQYEALKFITFPLLMIGKSFKMIPVMLWCIVLFRRRYKLLDWVTSIAITGGVILFLLTGRAAAANSRGLVGVGLLWILGFLVCDGFTLAFQEKLFSQYNTTRYNQMFYVNLISGLISLAILLITNTLTKSFAFWRAHPVIVADTFYLSVAVYAGQWCLYGQNQEFGAVVVAATMNVRQVVSTVISYAAYHHRIGAWQIVAFVIIFASLFMKAIDQFVRGPGAGDDEKQHLLVSKTRGVP